MLSEKEKNIPEKILDDMLTFLYMNGVYMKRKDNQGVQHIAVTVYPSPIPEKLYNKIMFYEMAFNKIILRLSQDQEYLEQMLTPIGEDEEFVKKNLEISKKVFSFEQKCKINFDIFRNDFMVDKDRKFIYQVEYNTIASSMGYFSDKMREFYDYFSKKYPEVYERYTKNNKLKIPESGGVISSIVRSMIEAIKLFSPDKYQSTIVIFVVQGKEKNLYDQKAVENDLFNKHGIKSKRMTFEEILKNCHKDENHNIYDEENNLISLFYFRAGYTEKDYPNEDCWKARELIELSTAVKCPNINLYLTTYKVFQSQLCKNEIISKYMNSELINNELKRFFLEINFIREMEATKRVEYLTKVLENPTDFIIKPQKEGGGNNYSGESIKSLIVSAATEPSTELRNSIVMEIIRPPSHENVFLKDEKPVIVEKTVSEFSSYGIVLSKENEMVFNRTSPFLVRSKAIDQKEGGIIAGVGAISVPCLVQMNETEEINFTNLI